MKKKARSGILEEDLCRPVSDYLTSLGYTVRSEVKHWDITAIKNSELIAVELKRSINVHLENILGPVRELFIKPRLCKMDNHIDPFG